jgi:hypothetical protein
MSDKKERYMRAKEFLYYDNTDERFKIHPDDLFDDLYEWNCYSNIADILNEMLMGNLVEWNDFKKICSEFFSYNHEIYADFPHNFYNQDGVKNKILEMYN